MCSPMALIGGALSIAGSMANASSQQAYVNAVNDANMQAFQRSKKAREDELGRQKAFEDDATAYWDRSVEALGANKRAENTDAAQARFMDSYDGAATPTKTEGTYLSGQASSEPTMVEEIARRIGESASKTRERITNLARLSGYGSADTANNLALGNSANWLTTINGLRRGSLGVSQQEQSIQPATVTPGSSIFGDILTGIGGLVSQGVGGFGAMAAPSSTVSVPIPRPNPLRVSGNLY